MAPYNPYLFPFGPEQNSAASSPASQSANPFDFESPSAYSANAPAPRNKSLSAATVPSQSAQPRQTGYGPPRKVAIAAKSAIVSLVLGIISLVSFFIGLSIFVALAAIITGHFGLNQIKHSAGALKGQGMARMGLITGYFGFVLSTIAIGWFSYMAAAHPTKQPPIVFEDAEDKFADLKGASNESELNKVEQLLEEAGADTAHGNNPKAKALAEQFNLLMRTFYTHINGTSPKIEQFKGYTYTTHCQMHADRVALMVRVHGSEQASASAQKTLAELCWITTSLGLKESLPPTHRLALCVRNSAGIVSLQYGFVGSGEALSGLKRHSLADFYASADDDLPKISSIELTDISNRPQFGPPADRPGLPARTPLADDDDADSWHDRTSSPSEKSLHRRLRTAPPSGIRQIAPAVPAYEGKTLELEPEKHAKLILDTNYGPRHNPIRYPYITAVRFSPDGKQLAVGTNDGNIYLYQLNDQNLYSLPVIDHAHYAISALAFSDDGKKLYVGSEDSSLFYYTLSYPPTNSNCTELKKQTMPPRHLVLSTDGNTLYSTDGSDLSQQPALRVGDIQKSNQSTQSLEFAALDRDGSGVLYSDGCKIMRLNLITNEHENLSDRSGTPKTPCDISPATQIFARCDNQSILLNSIRWRGVNDSFNPPMQPASLRFTPQGDRLVIGGKDTVSILEIRNAKHLADYKFDFDKNLVVRDISPDGEFVAVQTHLLDSVLYVLPLPEATDPPLVPHSVRPVTSEPIAKTSPLPDGFQPVPGPNELAKVDSDPNTEVEVLRPGNLPKEFSSTPPEKTPFDPNPQPISALLPNKPTVKQLPIAEHKIAVFNNLPRGADPIAFSPSGEYIIAAKEDNSLLHIDLDTKIARPIKVDDLGEVSAITYSQDGKTVYAGTNKGRIFALEINEAGKLVSQRPYRGHRGQVSSLIEGINGKFIASAGRDGRVVWQQLTNNGVLREIKHPGGWITSLYEIPGEPILLGSSGARVIRVNIRTTAIEPETLTGALNVQQGLASPDGKLIASYSNRKIIISDRLEGTELATLEALGANSGPSNMHFTSDNKYLLVVTDNTITAVNPREPQTLTNVILPPGRGLNKLTISPDGKRFAVYTDTRGEVLYVMSLTDLETLK